MSIAQHTRCGLCILAAALIACGEMPDQLGTAPSPSASEHRRLDGPRARPDAGWDASDNDTGSGGLDAGSDGSDLGADLAGQDAVEETSTQEEPPTDPDQPDVETGGGANTLVCEPPPGGFSADEICDNGQDDDGDGSADEGCPCWAGQAQPCYLGDPSTRNVGACLDGIQICGGSPPTWGECEGGFLPTEEVCDQKDNDCDGCTDDGIGECLPVLTCPVEMTTRPLSYFTLDGPSILNTDEEIVFWQWTVVPPQNSATPGPEDPNAINTQLYVDVSGDYRISLEAEDAKGTTFGCSFLLHAEGDGLRVELSWDTSGDTDLDLHLHRSGSTQDWCTPDDCYYYTCNVRPDAFGYRLPSWGYSYSPEDSCFTEMGHCPNPRLDIDNISLVGVPENINIDHPNDGDTFRIMVHYYSGDLPTRPRVTIYCGGLMKAVIGGEGENPVILDESGPSCGGDTWRVADIRMVEDVETGITDCLVNVLTDGQGGFDVRTDDERY